MTCECDNKTVRNFFCYLKAVSRIIVTLNLGLELLVAYTKPIYMKRKYFLSLWNYFSTNYKNSSI